MEYDPNRTARIALLHYADCEKDILAPQNESGDTIMASQSAIDPVAGNAMPLKMPPGTRSTMSNCDQARAGNCSFWLIMRR